MSDFPLALADRCVKCGLCLPHCPTYRATGDEGDSPRGRIALMQGLAGGVLPANARLQEHLDGCLTCRACEAVCPADVPYGRLIDSVREQLAAIAPARTRESAFYARVLTTPWLRGVARTLLWLYQRSGLQALFSAAGLLRRLNSVLPEVSLRAWRPASRGAGSVALFTNCTSPLAEPETLRAAVTLLEALGETVTVPERQGCCGAQWHHIGRVAEARACAANNISAFAAATQVVSVASGCTAELAEYGRLVPAAGEAFQRRVADVHAYLARHPRMGTLDFAPLKARALVQLPCTLRNVLHAGDAVPKLLARIPGLEQVAWSGGCCGAAGAYFLTQPEMADTLLAPLIEQVRQSQVDYVVSANVGCALHIAGGLRRAGLTTAVLAPVALLARQLRGAAAIRAAA